MGALSKDTASVGEAVTPAQPLVPQWAGRIRGLLVPGDTHRHHCGAIRPGDPVVPPDGGLPLIVVAGPIGVLDVLPAPLVRAHAGPAQALLAVRVLVQPEHLGALVVPESGLLVKRIGDAGAVDRATAPGELPLVRGAGRAAV